MFEARYRGAETLSYKQASLSDLKYIKIIYKDIFDEVHELKTEINFLSDSYISLFVKKRKEEIEEDIKEEIDPWEEENKISEASKSYYDNYLKKLTEVKEIKEKAEITGNYDEYHKKLAEIKQLQEESKKKTEVTEKSESVKEEEELSEIEEKELKKFEIECPQTVSLKFVIGELLYVAKAELRDVKLHTSKVYFNIKAPEILKFEQHRKFYRIDLKRLCLLVATNKEGSSDVYIARSINLSAGGVLINRLETMSDNKYVKLSPENYTKYNLVIVLESDKVLKLSARYVREEQGRKCNRYAFEFVDIEEAKINYISKYVIGKQIEELSSEFNIKNKQALKLPTRR